MNQNKFSTSIRNLLKKFQNHLQIARTLIVRKAIHETFVTLQEKSKNDEKSDQEKKANRFDQKANRKFENRFCVCEKNHNLKTAII